MRDVDIDDEEYRFHLGRSSILSTLLALLILGCPAIGSTGALLGLWDGPGGPLPDGIVGFVVPLLATLFWDSLLVLYVRHGLRALRRGAIVINKDGLWVKPYGKPSWLLPWSEIEGAGIGYELARPPLPMAPPKRDLWTLDLFVRPDAARRCPRLKDLPTLVDLPPRPGLPSQRRVIELPRLADLPHRIEAAITWTKPGTWVGRYHRHVSLSDAKGV